MNYIITKHPEFFDSIGTYNFCAIEELEHLPEEIAFDSETTGLFALVEDMFCCQIGTRKNNYIIHMYDDNYSFYDVIPFLEGKTLVMQNGLFDIGFMYKYNFIPYKVYDTMLGTRILTNGFPYMESKADFGSIMQRELGVTYDKTDQKNIHIVKLSVASAIKYSFNDVDRLQEAHDSILKKIKDSGQISTYLLHCRFIKALAYMERCGLPINSQAWMEKMIIDKENVKIYSKEITEFIHKFTPQFADRQLDMFDDIKRAVVNFRSSAQMIPVFNHLGINTKSDKGKNSIKEDVISKTKHPFVDLWLKYKGAQHRVSTFGQNVYDKIIEDRIYCNFNPMVDTARLASRKGSINFLNFSKDEATRDCFQAPPGFKMIVCDWSGQETVIMADASGDTAMTASVVEGVDLHCLLARELFPEIKDLSDDEIKKHHDDKRTAAKAPRFALQYGGNGYTLHINENIPLKEADKIAEKFFNLHEELFDWGRKNLYLAIKKGYIESADGWRLYLPNYEWFKNLKKKIDSMSKRDWLIYRLGKAERKREYMIRDKNANCKPGEKKLVFNVINKIPYKYYNERKKSVSKYFSLRSEYQRLALNNPIQTTGSHQMKLALCYIFEWIVSHNRMWKILMCNAVHDETIIQAPNSLAEETKMAVGEFMVKAGNVYLKNLTIKAEAKIGNSWYEAK